MSEYCTPREAALALDVSLSTVYYWLKAKQYFNYRLKGRMYQIPREQVEHYALEGFPRVTVLYDKAGAEVEDLPDGGAIGV